MKLSEITKKGFLDTLKNPHKALIRRTIKEYRKEVAPYGWKVYSQYVKENKDEGITPHIRMRIVRDASWYDLSGKLREQSTFKYIFEQLEEHFPFPPFEIQSWEGPGLTQITSIIFTES